jgi:hypothetical protein
MIDTAEKHIIITEAHTVSAWYSGDYLSK